MPFYFILQLGFAGPILKEKTIKISRNYMRGGNWELYPLIIEFHVLVLEKNIAYLDKIERT